MIEGANIIIDFSDGKDLIGLDNDLTFSELTIEQGTFEYINHTVVRVTETGEYLLVIENTIASDITELDFTDVDISESSRNAASKNNSSIEEHSDSSIPGAEDPDGDYNTPDVPELPDWNLLVEDLNLESITLPETAMAQENIALPDLNSVIGLLDKQNESLELDFDVIDTDASVLASIDSVKPLAEHWTSEAETFIDSDWNPIIEEFYYTSELV